MMGLPFGLTLSGGNASGTFNSSAGQTLSINYNPAFQFGSGTQTSSPSDTATQSASPVQEPASLVSPVTAPGLAGVNTALPGGALAPAAALPALSGNLLLWLVIGAAVILLVSDGGGHRR